MIDRRQRKAAVTEVAQYTGTPENVAEIKAWTGTTMVPGPLGPVRRPVLRTEMVAPDDLGAWLWLEHKGVLVSIAPGTWIVRELDGSGFYDIAERDMQLCYDELRCVRDTNGDGDCPACARNPGAPCRQPRVQPSVDGIRGHRIYTEAEADAARLAVLATPLLTPEQVERLGLIDKPAPLDYTPMPELGT